MGILSQICADKVFIIAEISANHNNSLENALELIRAAKEAGADAVKLQTYTPDTITVDSDLPHFIIDGTLWNGMKMYDLYSQAYTPWSWHAKLFEFAKSLNLVCFSTPFDQSSVEFLENLNCEIYKIASFEMTDFVLLESIAKTGKPIIMSTGMSDIGEIIKSFDFLKSKGASEIAVLKTNSSYPAKTDEMNLSAIVTLRERLGCVVGLSDHTLTNSTALLAVAAGARIIEKHICMNRDEAGPDTAFSLTPDEFSKLVDEIREVEIIMGDGILKPSESERKSLYFRRSLFYLQDLQEGATIDEFNIGSRRPNVGMSTEKFWDVLGRKLKRGVIKGQPVSIDDLGD
jgi:pseudaminic acid synthase